MLTWCRLYINLHRKLRTPKQLALLLGGSTVALVYKMCDSPDTQDLSQLIEHHVVDSTGVMDVHTVCVACHVLDAGAVS